MLRKFWKWLTKAPVGRCAKCGLLTNCYDYSNEWFICGKDRFCTSENVLNSLAEHVADPDGNGHGEGIW